MPSTSDDERDQQVAAARAGSTSEAAPTAMPAWISSHSAGLSARPAGLELVAELDLEPAVGLAAPWRRCRPPGRSTPWGSVLRDTGLPAPLRVYGAIVVGQRLRASCRARRSRMTSRTRTPTAERDQAGEDRRWSSGAGPSAEPPGRSTGRRPWRLTSPDTVTKAASLNVWPPASTATVERALALGRPTGRRRGDQDLLGEGLGLVGEDRAEAPWGRWR